MEVEVQEGGLEEVVVAEVYHVATPTPLAILENGLGAKELESSRWS
jgi:hypothetical protein